MKVDRFIIQGSIPDKVGPPLLKLEDRNDTNIQVSDALYLSQRHDTEVQEAEYPEVGRHYPIRIPTTGGVITWTGELICIARLPSMCPCCRAVVFRVDLSTYSLTPATDGLFTIPVVDA